MSYIPPAGAIGSVEVPGSNPIDLKTGRPLRIFAGVGAHLTADVDEREIGINTLTGAPPDVVSAFMPAPAVATIGRYRSSRWGSEQLVTLVEANLITPPTATPTDCLALRITGALGGGVIDLPLVAGYNVIGSGAVFPILSNAHLTPFGGGTGLAFIPSNPLPRGIAVPIRPLSDVVALSITYPYSSAGSTFADGYHAGHVKRVSILDTNLNEIVGAETTIDVTSTTIEFPLPYAVRLLAGERYYIASLITDGTQGANYAHPVQVRQLASTTKTGWTNVNSLTGVSDRVIYLTNAAPDGTQWNSFDGNPFDPADVTAGGLVYPDVSNPFMVASPADGTSAYTTTNLWTVNGAGGGTSVTGDLIASLIQLGAGPAAAGADLNLRVLIGAENMSA